MLPGDAEEKVFRNSYLPHSGGFHMPGNAGSIAASPLGGATP
jgi:hypothetical protein